MTSDESLGPMLATLSPPPPTRDRFWEDLTVHLVEHSSSGLAPWATDGRPPSVLARVQTHRPSRRRPLRVMLLIAAPLVLVVTGLVWLSSRDKSSPAGPGPDQTQPTVVDSGRPNQTITRPDALDLDPWLINAPAWPPRPAGPYLVFDVNKLPSGWTVKSVTSGNTLRIPFIAGSYRWTAELDSPGGEQFIVNISNDLPRAPLADSPTPVDVRGHDGTQSDFAIDWNETDTVSAEVRAADRASRQSALDLANALVTTTVDDLTGEPIPDAPEVVSPVSQPNTLQGSIGKLPWFVGVDSPGTGDMFLYLDGRLSVGSFSTAGADQPSTPYFDVEFAGVHAGVMIVGTAPASVASVRAELSDVTTIDLPIAPRIGGTAFAVPVPDGLDLVAVDFLDTQGTVVHRMLVPIFQHHTLGSLNFASLPFGNPGGLAVIPVDAPSTTLGSLSTTETTTEPADGIVLPMVDPQVCAPLAVHGDGTMTAVDLHLLCVDRDYVDHRPGS